MSSHVPSALLSDDIAQPFATSTYRKPIGSGNETQALDDDLWHAADSDKDESGFFDYDENYHSDFDYHLGEDWNYSPSSKNRNDTLAAQVEDDASVVAFGSGIVSFVGDVLGYGPNTVVIDHTETDNPVNNGNLYSLYGHMDLETVTLGRTVDSGDTIGSLGSEGTNNVHLHFAVYETDVKGLVPRGGIDQALIENAESITFDADGIMTSVTRAQDGGHVRYFSSDYFIDESAYRYRWYDYDQNDRYTVSDSRQNSDFEIFGLEGSDTIKAGLGADLLSGGSGNDLIFGRDGTDSIYGDLGNDVLFGVNGHDDVVYGGDGNDTLVSGGRGDTLVGGSFTLTHLIDKSEPDHSLGDDGVDVFRFVQKSSGTAVILDFENNVDKIDLSSLNTSFGELSFASPASGEGDIMIVVGDLSIVVDGLTNAKLDATDFIF